MYKAITVKLFDSFTKNTEIEKENFKTMLENNLFNNHKRQEWMNKEILKNKTYRKQGANNRCKFYFICKYTKLNNYTSQIKGGYRKNG